LIPILKEISFFSLHGGSVASINLIKILREKDKEYFVQNIGECYMQGYPEDIRKETVRFIEYPKCKPAYHSFTLMGNGWLVVIMDWATFELT